MITRRTHSHDTTKTNQSTNTTNHDMNNTISSDRTPTHVNDGQKTRVRRHKNRRSEVAPVVVHNAMVRDSRLSAFLL
jgi:hypothetical protein